MPLTPVGIAGFLQQSLASVSMTGQQASTLSLGIGNGTAQWIAAMFVLTTDVGVAGAGSGQLPLIIPPALLVSNMVAGFSAQTLTGTASVQLASAIGQGLAQAFLQGLVLTVHPVVGVGTAIAMFRGSPAVSFMLQGLSGVAMTGAKTPQLAAAIGQGLDTTFASFTTPIPIVGAGSIISASGSGTGKIV